MDIVLTWPKRVRYQSYVDELKRAAGQGNVILFKVSAFPTKTEPGDRCYMVHDGLVRGWTEIVGFDSDAEPHPAREGERWAKGKYIVRSPEWQRLLEPIKMQGFQGFRYAPKHWRERVSAG